MNIERALERFGGDHPFLIEMTKEFSVGLPSRIVELKVALDSGNAEDFGRRAHSLKGVAANFDAVPIAQLAAQLESLGHQGDLSPAPGLIADLEKEEQRFQNYLKEAGIS
jgi:HPt (histidine-containing phosphotransfer) domain-containing protein